MIDKNRIYVDFNEMITDKIVLLSQTDTKINISGEVITLFEGKKIYLYSDDLDDFGNSDYLVAEGFVIRTPIKGHVTKWSCEITGEILHESQLFQAK